MDELGVTALYKASSNNRLAVALELIKNNANVDMVYKQGQVVISSCLHVASHYNTEVLQALLEGGANINIASSDGATPLHWAADTGCLETVKVLIAYGANLEATQYQNETPLILAAARGHTEVVQELIKGGANVNAAQSDGCTALWKASSKGRIETVQVLIKNGATLEVTSIHDECTPLVTASKAGHACIVQELLKNGTNVNAACLDGTTALYWALTYSRYEIMQDLIRAGADMTLTYFGESCLMLVSQQGNMMVVKELIDSGANVNAAHKDNITPLYKAACNGHTPVVQHLLQVFFSYIHTYVLTY